MIFAPHNLFDIYAKTVVRTTIIVHPVDVIFYHTQPFYARTDYNHVHYPLSVSVGARLRLNWWLGRAWSAQRQLSHETLVSSTTIGQGWNSQDDASHLLWTKVIVEKRTRPYFKHQTETTMELKYGFQREGSGVACRDAAHL